VLTPFDGKYEKLTAGHPNAKKEVDLVRASIVQIRQLVQNSPKVNGNGAKLKQLADRAEAVRHTVCKFLDGQALFTGLFHMCTATYKETRVNLQPSSKESRQDYVSQAEQNKRRKVTETLEIECCIKKQKWPHPTYQNSRLAATSNFFAPLGDLPMENVEIGSEGNSTKTRETNEGSFSDKCRPRQRRYTRAETTVQQT
jgi:hypothetical protein